MAKPSDENESCSLAASLRETISYCTSAPLTAVGGVAVEGEAVIARAVDVHQDGIEAGAERLVDASCDGE